MLSFDFDGQILMLSFVSCTNQKAFLVFFRQSKPDPSSEAAFNKLRRKIRELEDEKAVFQSKVDQMKLEKCSEREAVVKERDNLQAEITKLQSRIEELMTLVGERVMMRDRKTFQSMEGNLGV